MSEAIVLLAALGGYTLGMCCICAYRQKGKLGAAYLILSVISLTVALMGHASAQFATATQNLRVPMVTVAGLPTCNAASQGLIYGVTDALTPVALSAPTGGGAVVVQVFCNGTAWIVS